MRILFLLLFLFPSLCFGQITKYGVNVQNGGIDQGRAGTVNCDGTSVMCAVSGSTVTISAEGGFGGINNIVSGSQTISCGFILGEDSSFMLGEDGGKISQECGGLDRILGEDGSFMLGEDGGKILNEDSQSSGTGTATPFFVISTLSSSAWVTANSSNSSTVYVGNSAVSSSNSIPLNVGEQNVYLPTYDLSNVYILGNAGDGVTFRYFGTSIQNSVTYLGNNVTYLGQNVTYLGL